MTDPAGEPLSFPCPRCHHPVTGRYYGPCEACRDELRATICGEGADVVAEAYEPKMNVTPNAVALKE
jgi:hypothetical protein